jgi:hypothetical protein
VNYQTINQQYKWSYTEINEEDEDEGENLGDAEQEEISLQNFYYEFDDKHPQMMKYLLSNNFPE